MDLKNIVPWGRLRKEYIKMFKLSDKELNSKILGCGDGPSSFNFENIGNVTSLDPIYQFTKVQIEERIKEVSDEICKELDINKKDFNWDEFKNINDLKDKRLYAMNMFLEDFNRGKIEKRYIYGELPKTEFSNNSFDLVLSSHFLFLYSDHLDLDFHINSIKEMLRVGKKVKIFPVYDLKCNKSVHLEPVIKWLKLNGYNYSITKTEYEFQKGVNELLEITKQ